jgi:hypothetical protein
VVGRGASLWSFDLSHWPSAKSTRSARDFDAAALEGRMGFSAGYA